MMTEAAIVFPILILTAMLLLRVFVFYLEILSTGVNEHMNALEAWDSYSGAGVRKYTAHKEITMLGGGILKMDLGKKITTESYLLNEDMLVRAGDLLD